MIPAVTGDILTETGLLAIVSRLLINAASVDAKGRNIPASQLGDNLLDRSMVRKVVFVPQLWT